MKRDGVGLSGRDAPTCYTTRNKDERPRNGEEESVTVSVAHTHTHTPMRAQLFALELEGPFASREMCVGRTFPAVARNEAPHCFLCAFHVVAFRLHTRNVHLFVYVQVRMKKVLDTRPRTPVHTYTYTQCAHNKLSNRVTCKQTQGSEGERAS